MNDINQAVREWARGMYPLEAGAELLIRQGRVIYEGAPWLDDLGRTPRMVSVDAGKLLEGTGGLSGGEQRIVRIAASLLDGTPVNLSDEVTGLDRESLLLVLAAIAHANGSHEHSEFVFENGRPTRIRRLSSAYPWPGAAQTPQEPS